MTNIVLLIIHSGLGFPRSPAVDGGCGWECGMTSALLDGLTWPFVSTDWTDVANNLLSQCHLNRRLRRLTDCDADVFVALYENILGEKVPGKRTL